MWIPRTWEGWTRGAAQALDTKGGSSAVQGDEEVRKTVFAQPSKHAAIKSALLMLSRENPQKLEPHVRLASEQQRPHETPTSTDPILTPRPKHAPSSALSLSQNKAKWALLPTEGSAGDAKGSLGDGPHVTRSNPGK